MTTNNPWDRLAIGEARRVSGSGRFDYFWIMLENLIPGLALKLSPDQKPILPMPQLRSLDLRYRIVGESQALVLGLRDKALSDLFRTLCHDVVDAGEGATSPDDALSRTLQRTRRWHHLLRGGTSEQLSIEEQQGLVAELAFLREIASAKGPDFAVEGWKGPEGASKDFEFPNVCVEIKARRNAAKPLVAISSEDQLADVGGARLFLKVTDVATAIQPDGMTLHDHVALTMTSVDPSASAVARLEDLLASAGYDCNHQYEGRRWILGGHRGLSRRMDRSCGLATVHNLKVFRPPEF